ncbi:ABC transporter ATP-binding protein [Cohnella massiliensis]|uniref:ABC transporter ATP-binding protein n=2 Tax=Cohnella TaxID=329857 RepID=UPI0009BAD0FC|nr:ABC transporter ATP-binding protein [Cohnella massiliensis]
MNIHHANDAVFSAVPAIRCRAVGAKWKKKTLLEAVGFDVPQGSICGLLGPNGAGKSTLLRMLTGLVPPDSGEVLLFGQKAGERTLAQVSYLPDRGQLPGWLSVADWLELASGIYPDWNRARQRELAQKLAVDPAARIGALSRGEEARLQLLTCLSRQAPLIVLDEPFTGVDLVSRERIASAVVGDMADGFRTFLIATHDIREMESIFDRIVLLGDGKVKGAFEVEELRREGRSVESCYREVFA